jgi:hypothetical protein
MNTKWSILLSPAGAVITGVSVVVVVVDLEVQPPKATSTNTIQTAIIA